jgi:hypothetical protein
MLPMKESAFARRPMASSAIQAYRGSLAFHDFKTITILSLIWKNKCRLRRSPCCLCVCVSPHQIWMPEPIFIKLCMYTCIMELEPIWTVHFIHLFHQSVCCLYLYYPVVARQGHGNHVPAAKTTRTTMEELLDASFSVRSLSYQRNADD